MVFGSTGNFSIAWRQISGQRAQQQPSGMLGVVRDARHHLRSAEALRILKRSVRDQLAALQIQQPQHDRRGAQVHRDARESARSSGPLRRHRSGCDRRRASPPDRVRVGRLLTGSPSAWRSMRMCPRRMVWQRTCPLSAVTNVWHDSRKFPFRCRSGSVSAESALIPSTTSTMHSLHLPCLRHDVGTSMPKRLSVIEQRQPARRLDRLPVDGESNGHCSGDPTSSFASSSAFTASATSRAEPSRSSSSLHFHCAR